MDTVIRVTDVEKIDMNVIYEAGSVIRHGGLVAFPTETVYGLGADGMDETASAKIYAAKGRPSDNPLILHISSMDMLDDIAAEIPDSAKLLMEKYWPGPMTLVFKKKAAVPYGTTGGLDTVAVRYPSHPVALSLIEAAGTPIAAPSANTSGRPSPTEAKHVIEDMDGRIDMIIDGGQVGIGIESTIVDVTSDVPMILRPGYITKSMVEQVVGQVKVDKVVEAKSVADLGGDYAPKAPGMKYKHYAPKAELTMFEGPLDKVIDYIGRRAAEDMANGDRVGIIATDESKHRYPAGKVVSIGSRKDEESIARGLYGILRDFDDIGVDVIYSETFYDDDLGQAIMNRLIKAAGYKIVDVSKM
ncbi:MAG: threonylcarbamoyl-AMP synthase [Lachnospiraceae bacterium]|nr:threonylcarbamoyl-AMP synthase [Lachnospiraceae bacterium]